ncbi:hypothetical protein Sipo8835_07140 [Streptomyces ipomoeae]|nr:hypothetical protein Sipo7851_45775 [Streptomyces ipomoeae]TQE26344.1 hypothetical protein SipoB123_14300 [Streptomyces ipomoeae]TQE37779.1 hypothetical protein Sipo8835_07140 [Streptomyces ipomoeae]
MTAPRPLRDIEARHPALRGAKSPMQTIRIKPRAERDVAPLLAGAAAAVAGVGAVLAFTDADSVLRGPFTLFFLLVAPGAAIGAALRGLEPFGRVVASVAGAIAVNLLVAQGMLATHSWSVPGGIAAVTVISSLVLLLVLVRRVRGRTERRRT